MRRAWISFSLLGCGVLLTYTPLNALCSLHQDHWYWWQIFTAHFCHFTSSHFLWDALVVYAAASYCETRYTRKVYSAVTLLTIVLSSMWFLYGQSQWDEYRGLSALACAYVGLAACSLIRSHDRFSVCSGYMLALGLCGKIGCELNVDQSLCATLGEGVTPVVMVHVIGVCCAGLVGVLCGQPKYVTTSVTEEVITSNSIQTAKDRAQSI